MRSTARPTDAPRATTTTTSTRTRSRSRGTPSRCRRSPTTRTSEIEITPMGARRDRAGDHRVGRARLSRCRPRSCSSTAPSPTAGPTRRTWRRPRRRCSRRSATSASRRSCVGTVSGPHVSRFELQLAPGHEGRQGRAAQGRPRLRARIDRHPHPRPDPGQAGGRRRGAELAAPDGPPRRHLPGSPEGLEPAHLLARQGHLRPVDLDRPGEDAAHPDRRHHRLGQVRLRQRDPQLDAAAQLAQRAAPRAGRPQAGRAQPLRLGSRICSRRSSPRRGSPPTCSRT